MYRQFRQFIYAIPKFLFIVPPSESSRTIEATGNPAERDIPPPQLKEHDLEMN
jgi:hypothetical protein